MTLRKSLNDDARRLHDQLDELLDREDGVIVFMDAQRLVSYVKGFGVSPCQLELLTIALERAVRQVVQPPAQAPEPAKGAT